MNNSAIYSLVERFHEFRPQYRSPKYKETPLRREFIDPFLEALGWDVSNVQGRHEAFKQVIHEDSILINGRVKAPDYTLTLNGQRRLFVEAKKPSINIKDSPHPAFQVRRYAWNAKLPLSLVTDFEELALYDCRDKPSRDDSAQQSRIKYLTYDEYIDHWDELVSLLSPDAIRQGSLEQYARKNKTKRGTAEVDDAFLAEMSAWREQLARNIALRNPYLNRRQLNYSVQSTIDRIVFLRIAEDRGIEPYGRLREIIKQSDVYNALVRLFLLADAKYNSGLFHFNPERGRDSSSLDTFTLKLSIDDTVLRHIIKRLYYPDSPYQFDVIPADILGQVYEQFLGKVIRLTPGGQATVEDKPEVKKAGGVFYTPTYIVDYIVGQTVGQLLEGKTPGPKGSASKIRILDPAAGSGSFLLGAYQYLLNWHLEQYEKSANKWSRGKEPVIWLDERGEWRLTIGERKRILLSNIYGVDIDPQAVEVTKLSLLLKVMEGENDQSLGNQMQLLPERVLPDLSHNIQCGNSLVSPDYYDGQQLSLGILDEEEIYRINVFNWTKAFPDVFNNGGFDAVIGNPPYVIISKDIHSKDEIDYLKQFTVAQFKADLFHLFIQRGVELLKANGKFGFIVPNTWLTLKFTNQLRQYILRETKVEELVVFDHLVFRSANVYTALLFLNKENPKEDSKIRIRKPKSAYSVESILSSEIECAYQKSWIRSEGSCFETRLVGPVGDLVRKILDNNPSLSSVARASLGCQAYNSSKHTKEQIKNRIFHAETQVNEEYLPELAGSDVGRYEINRIKGKWLKYGPWLHDYRTMDWLTGPRILIREIAGKPPYRILASYVEETYCNYKTILNVNPTDETPFSMKYLLGLLNSRLLSFLYPYLSDKLVVAAFPRLTVRDVRKLPIRNVDIDNITDMSHHNRMVTFVDQMLELQKQLAKAQTTHERNIIRRQVGIINHQIDHLVYQLYHLTPEEIRVVEAI